MTGKNVDGFRAFVRLPTRAPHGGASYVRMSKRTRFDGNSRVTERLSSQAGVRDLFALWWIQERLGEFCESGYLAATQAELVREGVRGCLATVRLNAVALADAWGHSDHALNSTLGRYARMRVCGIASFAQTRAHPCTFFFVHPVARACLLFSLARTRTHTCTRVAQRQPQHTCAPCHWAFGSALLGPAPLHHLLAWRGLGGRRFMTGPLPLCRPVTVGCGAGARARARGSCWCGRGCCWCRACRNCSYDGQVYDALFESAQPHNNPMNKDEVDQAFESVRLMRRSAKL